MVKSFKDFVEQYPTVSVGSGQIDGIGFGSNGEPGISDHKRKQYKDNNKRKKDKRRTVMMLYQKPKN